MMSVFKRSDKAMFRKGGFKKLDRDVVLQIMLEVKEIVELYDTGINHNVDCSKQIFEDWTRLWKFLEEWPGGTKVLDDLIHQYDGHGLAYSSPKYIHDYRGWRNTYGKLTERIEKNMKKISDIETAPDVSPDALQGQTGKEQRLTGKEAAKDLAQMNLIHAIYDSSINDDKAMFEHAVNGLATLREEQPMAVAFQLFKAQDEENRKLVKQHE